MLLHIYLLLVNNVKIFEKLLKKPDYLSLLQWWDAFSHGVLKAF